MIYRILIISAMIPAVVLMKYVYDKDHTEKEPLSLLLLLVVAGVIATFAAGKVEEIGLIFLSLCDIDNDVALFIEYFLIVGLAEEGFKLLFLKIASWNNKAFNTTYDGILYASFVSLGFALYENINYVLNYGLSVAVTRAFTAVPGHFCFGVLMGIFYGISKQYTMYGDKRNAKKYSILALIVPMTIHGLYDYLIVSNARYSNILFVVGLIILFIIIRNIVNKTSQEDSNI